MRDASERSIISFDTGGFYVLGSPDGAWVGHQTKNPTLPEFDTVVTFHQENGRLEHVTQAEEPTVIFVNDQPCTPMPKTCTIFGCGGTIFDSGGLMICGNCGRSYGEA